MKKKLLLAITLVIIISCNFLAGCSFTGTNTNRYYNTVIAKVGDSEITKYELMSSYNSYGYQYVSYSGYTQEEAIEEVLNQLINREVLVKYVTENFKELFGYDELKDWEVSEVWEDVFEYVNDKEVLTYYNDLREMHGLEKIEVEDDDDSTTTTTSTNEYIRKEYESPFIYTFGENGKITSITAKPTEHNISLRLGIDDFEYKFYGEVSDFNKRLNKTAQEQYEQYLVKNNKDKSLKTKDEIITAHFKELYNTLEKTYKVTKFQEVYTDNKPVDMSSILAKYKECIQLDYQKYTNNKSDYISAVQSDASNVYFHPYEDELVYVSHILIKFDKDDSDYNLKTVYENQLSNGEISQEQFDLYTSDEYLAGKCSVYQIVDGKFDENPLDMDANQLYDLVDNKLSQIKDPDKRLNEFINLAYMYNQDTAMFTSSDFYTVQLDKKYTDTMVQEFADLARNLYNEKGSGSYGMCITQYGAHIVYVVGTVKNKIINTVTDNTLSSITIDKMYNTVLRSNQYLMSVGNDTVNEKTLLDVFAEKVKLDDYQDYIKGKLNELKNDMGKNGIIIYKDRYKDLIG